MRKGLSFSIACLLGLAVGAHAASAQGPAKGHGAKDHGAKVYQRCAACHLPNGAGVPGAFPRIAGRIEQAAAGEAGRDYLVMVVSKGLAGEIEIDGRKYRGVMPAQAGLTDEDVAAVLNFTMTLKKPGEDASKAGAESPKLFTKEEVAEIRARHDAADPRLVHSIRAGVFDVPLPDSPAAPAGEALALENNESELESEK